MPLISRMNVSDSELFLWRITETEEVLSGMVSAGDRASAAGFASQGRRLERLAWRAALRVAGIGNEVAYSETGAPGMVGSEKHISVSHCAGVAALLVAERPCAVDIERADRDCSRAAVRFITDAERAVMVGVADAECAAWCAKEALYKYSGRTELDFIRDIRIVGKAAGGRLDAEVAGVPAKVEIVRAGEYIIAVIA